MAATKLVAMWVVVPSCWKMKLSLSSFKFPKMASESNIPFLIYCTKKEDWSSYSYCTNSTPYSNSDDM
jgi:hypothetical protein